MSETKRKPTRGQLVREWIKALRSGKYKQTFGFLCVPKESGTYPQGYCCLGVACEVYRKHYHLEVAERGYSQTYDGAASGLPLVVREAFGIRDTLGEYKSGALYLHNDAGKSFKQIAAIIERKPKGLFVED
jgi:hypothetical protein